jgi:hypothetical protein
VPTATWTSRREAARQLRDFFRARSVLGGFTWKSPLLRVLKSTVALSRRRRRSRVKWRLPSSGQHLEGLEPPDRSHDLPRLSIEVEAAGRGDRSMQQSPRGNGLDIGGTQHRPSGVVRIATPSRSPRSPSCEPSPAHRPSGVGEDRNVWAEWGIDQGTATSTDLPGSVRIATPARRRRWCCGSNSIDPPGSATIATLWTEADDLATVTGQHRALLGW